MTTTRDILLYGRMIVWVKTWSRVIDRDVILRHRSNNRLGIVSPASAGHCAVAAVSYWSDVCLLCLCDVRCHVYCCRDDGMSRHQCSATGQSVQSFLLHFPSGLPWGLNFNPHTHPIPTEKPVGIPTESPYPQNPEILHTRSLYTLCIFVWCIYHFIFCHLYAVS